MDCSSDFWSLGRGTHPTETERTRAARAAWRGGKHKEARSAMRVQGRSKTGVAPLPYVKLAPMSAPGLAGDNSIWMQRSPCSDLHGQVGYKNLPEECCRLHNTQVMFLKIEKEPATKKMIRSLTEGEAITGEGAFIRAKVCV